MDNNNELIILSLLNLHMAYINLKMKKNSKNVDKRGLGRCTSRQLQSDKISIRESEPDSRYSSTKLILGQNGATSNGTSLVKSSPFGNASKDPDISVPVGTYTIGEKSLLDKCEGASNFNRVSSTNTHSMPSINADERAPTGDVEIKRNLVERLRTKKSKGGKERDPNKKPRVRRWRVRPINMDRFRTGYHRKVFVNVKKMDEQQFFEHTRMSKSLFDWLLSFVQSSLRRSKQLILAEERLALTLNYLAYGTSLQSLAWKHKVGKSTARQIVLDTCSVLWSLLSPIYLSETTPSQYADISEELKSKWQIPNCVGAVDGKNVSIRVPRYKDCSNLLILGACDAKFKFSAVSVGNFNNQSDDGVFKLTSANNAKISDNLPLPSNKPLFPSSPPFPYFFISGTSFPLQKNIMRPYADTNLDSTKTIFNLKISRARLITENTFGVLTARFRVLLSTIEFLPESCKTIILACIALHNYIMTNDDKQLYCPDNFVDRENEYGIIEEGEWRKDLKNNKDKPLPSMTTSHTRSTLEAVNLRDILANFFASETISYEIEFV